MFNSSRVNCLIVVSCSQPIAWVRIRFKNYIKHLSKLLIYSWIGRDRIRAGMTIYLHLLVCCWDKLRIIFLKNVYCKPMPRWETELFLSLLNVYATHLAVQNDLCTLLFLQKLTVFNFTRKKVIPEVRHHLMAFSCHSVYI